MAERRFIDANNLIEEIREERCYNCRNLKYMKCDYCSTADYIYMIEDMPTADVAPVRHGRWVEKEKYTFGIMYDCSLCENRILDTGHPWHYCPNCGAKMDEPMEEDKR